ncbi:hypothetical protein T310_8359 [Rasamsonia emersonii CBS 393.64]|uniref:Uncharacterized protein n=1 Tax=Rasamsonia emersonii (strain ATCC 16479 / CBS 393.64 / IMI 116815) TaxID=1408163 RepID=A0A0F4YHN8_RASE3|nr:hypothetical protein T310_8359 [Rasamsonia emersonii CBS 393.64]KKA17699.1 hypothetical protein T310_8359 [Rasamsonia emersonii CBS 393.64]
MSRRAGLLAAAPVTSPPAANIPRTPRSRRGHSPGVTNPHRIAWPFSSRDRRPLRRPQQAPARHYGELCRFLRCSVCQLSGSAQLSSGPGMSCYVLSCPCAPDLGADRAWDMRLMRCPMEVMSRDAYLYRMELTDYQHRQACSVHSTSLVWDIPQARPQDEPGESDPCRSGERRSGPSPAILPLRITSARSSGWMALTDFQRGAIDGLISSYGSTSVELATGRRSVPTLQHHLCGRLIVLALLFGTLVALFGDAELSSESGNARAGSSSHDHFPKTPISPRQKARPLRPAYSVHVQDSFQISPFFRSEHPCQRNAVPENGTVATVACQGGGQLRQFGKLEEAFLPGKVLAPHRERARRRAKAPARWAGMERRIPIF